MPAIKDKPENINSSFDAQAVTYWNSKAIKVDQLQSDITAVA